MRAERGQDAGELGEHEVHVVAEPDDDPAPSSELARVQALLGQLRGPVAIQLFRKKPTWCAGFLTEVVLGDDEELDLRQLKEDWGGGEIQLRPRIMTNSGSKWAKGGGVVKFTGPPRERGREISPDGYAKTDERSPFVVETRPAPVKHVPQDQGPYQLMGVMFQGMMTMMSGLLQQQRAPAVSAANPLGALSEQLAAYHKIKRSFFPEDDEEEDEPAAANPLEKLIKLGLDHLEKKEKGQQGNGGQQANAVPKGFRLHKAANPASPAANARANPKELLEALQALPESEQMEILGALSANIPPELIQRWMTENMGGDSVAS